MPLNSWQISAVATCQQSGNKWRRVSQCIQTCGLTGAHWQQLGTQPQPRTHENKRQEKRGSSGKTGGQTSTLRRPADHATDGETSQMEQCRSKQLCKLQGSHPTAQARMKEQ